jgi:hypothetical protein
VWDTSLFRFLWLRVKGDERRYYINVQADTLDPLELWQHRLFLRTPGQWETVLIPWADFLRTRNGRVTYKKFDGMDREKVKTVGASLIERKEGPFCLHIAEIKVFYPSFGFWELMKSVNTHGNHGPMTRYTPEETRAFVEEESKRTAEETAAYYAWKRGETPIGTTPTYIPPEPVPPKPTSISDSDTVAKLDHPELEPGAAVHLIDEGSETAGFSEGVVTASAGTPGGTTARQEAAKAMDLERDPSVGQTRHLFDDPLFRDEDPESVLRQDTEGGYDIRDKGSVDIDSVDVDDISPEGRDLKLKAMADELSSFSKSQRSDAAIVEEERIKRGREEGRKIMDHFGQRFEEAPPRRK